MNQYDDELKRQIEQHNKRIKQDEIVIALCMVFLLAIFVIYLIYR